MLGKIYNKIDKIYSKIAYLMLFKFTI